MVKLPDSCRKFKSRLIAPFGKTSANLASAFWGVQHRPSQEIGTDVDTADFLQRQWLPLWQLLRKCSILPQPKHFVDHSTFHSTSFDLRNSDAVRIKTAFHTSDRSADGEDSAGALEHKVCLSSRFPSGQCLVLNHLRKQPEIQNRFFLRSKTDSFCLRAQLRLAGTRREIQTTISIVQQPRRDVYIPIGILCLQAGISGVYEIARFR